MLLLDFGQETSVAGGAVQRRVREKGVRRSWGKALEDLARIFHGRIKIRIEAEPATSKRVKRNAVRLGCDPPLARMSF
jgi:hypothetical protein